MKEGLINGLIGISGTVVGIFINRIFESIGKVKFIKEIENSGFYSRILDGLGGYTNLSSKENATIFECELKLQIYNSKKNPKIFNKINFIFKTDTGAIIKKTVQNKDDYKYIAQQKEYKEISNIRIDGQSLIEFNLKCYLTDNIESLKNSKMYFQYYDVVADKLKEEFIMNLKELE
ncbi:MAG: hypothetical protein ACRC57_00530 [Sarcina sp.]